MTSEPAEQAQMESGPIGRSFNNLADIAKSGLRTFGLTHMIVDFVLGPALAIVCFYIAHDGVWWRGIVAGTLAVLAALVFGFFLATKLGVIAAAMRAVETMGLGKQILESLYDRFSPDFLASKSITLDELRGKLTQAAADVVPGEGTGRSLSGLGRWIVNKIWRLITWAVVRTVLRHARAVAAPNGMIDVTTLRNHLAAQIDNWLVDYLRAYVRKLAINATLVVVALACLVAYAIRNIPATAGN